MRHSLACVRDGRGTRSGIQLSTERVAAYVVISAPKSRLWSGLRTAVISRIACNFDGPSTQRPHLLQPKNGILSGCRSLAGSNPVLLAPRLISGPTESPDGLGILAGQMRPVVAKMR